MTDIVKVKQDGVQVYPQTHAGAILGLTTVKGDPGEAATITVGTVTTGAAGSSAAVTNVGTTSATKLNFTIPKGDKGDPGANATTTVVATTIANGLMSAADKTKLTNLPVISFEKVGTV